MSENLQTVSLDDVLSNESEAASPPQNNPIVEQAIVPETPLLPENVLAHIQNPPFIQHMIEKINGVDRYAWERGSMGLNFGFETLNKAFNVFNPGLHLVAGGANTGRDLT